MSLNTNHLTVISQDELYINTLYEKIKQEKVNITAICTNILNTKDSESEAKRIKKEWLIAQDVIDFWRHPTTPNNITQNTFSPIIIAELLAKYTNRYLIVSQKDEEMTKALKVYFNEKSKIDINEKEYILYEIIK